MLPGKKSPSPTNAELGERDAEAEPCRADCGGVAGAKSKVSASSPTTTAMPHDEQKRPFSVRSVPQVVQVDMNFPKQVYRVGVPTTDCRSRALHRDADRLPD
jgi:hypothetical protein